MRRRRRPRPDRRDRRADGGGAVRGHTAEIGSMLNQDAIAMLAATFPGGSGGVQGGLQMMPGLHVLDDANTPPPASLGSH